MSMKQPGLHHFRLDCMHTILEFETLNVNTLSDISSTAHESFQQIALHMHSTGLEKHWLSHRLNSTPEILPLA